MDLSQLAIGVLAATAVGGAAYALLYPYLAGSRAGRSSARRRSWAPARAAATRDPPRPRPPRDARKSTNSLKEIETRQKEANKLTLERRIAQAGLNWDKQKFYHRQPASAGSSLGAGVLHGRRTNPIGARPGPVRRHASACRAGCWLGCARSA